MLRPQGAADSWHRQPQLCQGPSLHRLLLPDGCLPGEAAGQQQVIMSLPAKLLSKAICWLLELSAIPSQPRNGPPEVGSRQQPAAFQVVEKMSRSLWHQPSHPSTSWTANAGWDVGCRRQAWICAALQGRTGSYRCSFGISVLHRDGAAVPSPCSLGGAKQGATETPKSWSWAGFQESMLHTRAQITS